MQPLESLDQDVIYYCTHCSAGLVLKYNRIRKVSLRFAAPKIQHTEKIRYLPFWVFPTKGLLFSRETHSAQRSGSLRKKQVFAEDCDRRFDRKAIGKFETEFFVPAFNVTAMIKLGAVFSAKRHEISETTGSRLLGGVISEEEAREIADLIYIFIEAAKSDWLKEIDFSLDLGDPKVVAMPFEEKDKKIHDLLHGYYWPNNLFPDWPRIVSFERDKLTHRQK